MLSLIARAVEFTAYHLVINAVDKISKLPRNSQPSEMERLYRENIGLKAQLEAAKKEIKNKFKAVKPSPKTPRKIYSSSRRQDIIQSAIELFRKKGFSKTSITDIVTHSRIGRDTFYHNFKNKEELFLECADRVIYEMFNDVWDKIKQEKDIRRRFLYRWEAFLKAYLEWIDMMNLVRGNSVRDNPSVGRKLGQLMDQIIEPLIKDLERAKEQGYINKEFDSTVLAYLLMGGAEYCAYLVHQKRFDPKAMEKVSVLWKVLA